MLGKNNIQDGDLIYFSAQAGALSWSFPIAFLILSAFSGSMKMSLALGFVSGCFTVTSEKSNHYPPKELV